MECYVFNVQVQADSIGMKFSTILLFSNNPHECIINSIILNRTLTRQCRYQFSLVPVLSYPKTIRPLYFA